VGRRFQRHREQRLELIVGVQRDQGSSQGAELGDEPVTQQRPGAVLLPQLAELRDARDGMGGDEGAVDAADRGTQHEIRLDAPPPARPACPPRRRRAARRLPGRRRWDARPARRI
jgi:hypothetical protein